MMSNTGRTWSNRTRIWRKPPCQIHSKFGRNNLSLVEYDKFGESCLDMVERQSRFDRSNHEPGGAKLTRGSKTGRRQPSSGRDRPYNCRTQDSFAGTGISKPDLCKVRTPLRYVRLAPAWQGSSISERGKQMLRGRWGESGPFAAPPPTCPSAVPTTSTRPRAARTWTAMPRAAWRQA